MSTCLSWIHNNNTKAKNKLYKHFSPDAVEEANLSEWDNNVQRMVTLSEHEATDEEKEIAALPWLIDMGALKSPISEDSLVKFNDGN